MDIYYNMQIYMYLAFSRRNKKKTARGPHLLKSSICFEGLYLQANMWPPLQELHK